MRRSVRIGVFAATFAGLGISSTLVAFASWAVPSRGATARAVAGTMPSGITPTARLEDGHALVSWGTQELRPGLRMQRYLVTAHSVDVVPRPDVARTVAASGASAESAVFTSSELGGGKWKWAIRPLFESWTGAEGRLSDKVSVPTPAPATLLADAMTDATLAPAAALNPASSPAATRPARPPATPAPADTPATSTPSPTSPPPAAGTTPAGTPVPVDSTTPVKNLPPPVTNPPKGMPTLQALEQNG